MATHDLSKQALIQAFEEASEHFSEHRRLEQKLAEDRYLDGDLLGEGGAKLVYLTVDRVTGRSLVRVYPKSAEMEEDFLREAMLHAHLAHPNIVPFYDIGLEDGRPFFCMKRIEGETLDQHVVKRRGVLGVAALRNELLDAFLKVCDAVSYAHGHDVLHLDLKPSNIQLSSYGEVLVGDWGLARVADSVSSWEQELPESYGFQGTGQFTRHGYLSGTPGFMAPEQCCKGESKTVQTDVYALGAILVFILTGDAPICGNGEQVVADTRSGKWSFELDAIPLGLRAVVNKALAVDREVRYPDVAALQDDIKAYRAGFLTSAEEYSSRRLLQSLYRRNKTTVHLLSVFLLILLVVTAVFVRQLKVSESGALAAERRAVDERQKTERAFGLLQRTQREKQEQEQTFASDYLRESVAYYKGGQRGRYNYDPQRDKKAYQLVHKALQTDSDNQEAWALQGKLAMLTGRMEVARISFERAGEAYGIHHQVCVLFEDQDLKDVRVLAAMLWELLPSEDLRLIHDFMFKTIFRKLPEEQMLYFIEESLNIRNQGKAQRLHFAYDPVSRKLDLSGNKQLVYIFMLKNLRLREIDLSHTSVGNDFYHLEKMPLVRVNVAWSGMNNQHLRHLSGRPIRELVLTGCKVSQLAPLKDCPLERLDLRHTRIERFEQLLEFSELKKVICTEGQKARLIEAGMAEEVVEVGP